MRACWLLFVFMCGAANALDIPDLTPYINPLHEDGFLVASVEQLSDGNFLILAHKRDEGRELLINADGSELLDYTEGEFHYHNHFLLEKDGDSGHHIH